MDPVVRSRLDRNLQEGVQIGVERVGALEELIALVDRLDRRR